MGEPIVQHVNHHAHVALPPSYAGVSDVGEFINHFDVCKECNAWDDAKAATKIAVCLSGQALAIYLALSPESRKDYKEVQTALLTAFKPAGFTAMSQFHARRLAPGENPAVFVYELRKLLKYALEGMPVDQQDKLILHQFLTGLPATVGNQLRAMGVSTLADGLERAKLMLLADEHHKTQVAAVEIADRHEETTKQLMDAVATLTLEVAAIRQGNTYPPQQGPRKSCDYCHIPGHLEFDCRKRLMKEGRCFNCREQGHMSTACPKGKGVMGNRLTSTPQH